MKGKIIDVEKGELTQEFMEHVKNWVDFVGLEKNDHVVNVCVKLKLGVKSWDFFHHLNNSVFFDKYCDLPEFHVRLLSRVGFN